jgi:hypothetical protein
MTAIMQRESSALQIAAQANQLLNVGDLLVKSGMLPNSIRTPEAAMAIIVKGMELGLPPMAALAGITVIQGKPTVSPQLMLSLINLSGQLENLDVETGMQGATVTMKRRGRSAFTSRFGPAEAKAMGLDSKDNYKKQAPVMYQWRAVAGCARVVFPDVIDGLYTPEEMGAEVQVDEDGAMTVSVQQEAKPDRTADVTREVAQSAGVPVQQAAPVRSEALLAWEEKIGKIGKRLAELNLRTEAIAILDIYPNWKTDTADAAAAYDEMKRLGMEHKPAQAEPVEAEVVSNAPTITDGQRKALMGQLKRLSIPNTSEARSAFYTWMVAIPEGTRTNALSSDDAQGLIDLLSAMDPGEIEATASEFLKEVKL